jgi:flagellar biosynthesis/type III secretory pathway M-ring protein FliF/YscJ
MPKLFNAIHEFFHKYLFSERKEKIEIESIPNKIPTYEELLKIITTTTQGQPEDVTQYIRSLIKRDVISLAREHPERTAMVVRTWLLEE